MPDQSTRQDKRVIDIEILATGVQGTISSLGALSSKIESLCSVMLKQQEAQEAVRQAQEKSKKDDEEKKPILINLLKETKNIMLQYSPLSGLLEQVYLLLIH